MIRIGWVTCEYGKNYIYLTLLQFHHFFVAFSVIIVFLWQIVSYMQIPCEMTATDIVVVVATCNAHEYYINISE